jgi:ATPase family AAA domain-containing protein 3A/B
MSWLFGLNKGQQGVPDVPSFPGAPGSGGDGDDKTGDRQGQKSMDAYRFDSAALERAAKAAKELERSRTLISRQIHNAFGDMIIFCGV